MFTHTHTPNVLYLMFKEKRKDKKKRQKKSKQKKKQKQINKQKKKNASDFSTRQRSTPLLPMRLHGFLYYTYICVLVGRPCPPEEVSACSSVSN